MGIAGTDSSNMADYYDPDGTLRNPNEIFALWKTQGIEKGDKLAFIVVQVGEPVYLGS